MNKINTFSLNTITNSLSLSTFWGILTSFMLHKSLNGTIIALLIGYIINLLIITLILRIFNYKKDISFVNKIKYLFKKTNKLINTIFILLSIIFFVLLTYRLSTFLSNEYLSHTNEIYFFILIFILLLYLTNKGIENISRVSTIIFYLSTIIFFIIATLLLKDINFNNYLPLINTKISNIFISSIIYGIYFSIPTIYINIINKNNLTDKKKFNKSFYLTNLYSFVISFLAISITLGVYGINLCNIFNYPLYSVLKKIQLFSFIDSLENLSVILWIYYTIIASSVILQTIFKNTKETYNKSYKLITIIIIFILMFILNKYNSFIELYNYIYIPFIIFILLLLFIILINLKIKKEK